MKTLIKNAWILTMDERLSTYKEGMVLIEGDRIAYVGEDTSSLLLEVDEVIDAKGGLLIPGMINVHTHVSMIPFRTLGDDCKDRLRRYLFPLENECMRAALVYEAARYGILEMQRSGVTTFLDMYYFEEEVAKACEELRMRGVLGETVINFPTCDSEKAYGGLVYAESFIKKWQHHDLVTPIIAPHATNTNDAHALKAAHRLAEKYDTLLTMHVAEMDYEMKEFAMNYQMTPIEYLDSIGILSERLIAAHCIHLNESDMKLMQKRKTRIAHCVGSNMKAGKGIAPVKEMVEHQLIVGLGTDGPSSGNTLDLFTQMKTAVYAQKTHYQDRSLFKASEILKLATIEGAKVLRMDDQIGSLEVGKKADIVLIETDSVNMFPIYDPYSAIVYSANASNVDSVWINGQQVLKDKKSIFNQQNIKKALYQEMQEFSQRAIERANGLD
ncbi:MAG: amidohydrolase [Turicibacter sp.]|nr:amidohydrolase [Turicibacter sp.]